MGPKQETLILAYKYICRSALELAAPVWAPAISNSRWSDLQTVQSRALRIATHLPEHPGNKHLNRHQPPRQIKQQKYLNIFRDLEN